MNKYIFGLIISLAFVFSVFFGGVKEVVAAPGCFMMWKLTPSSPAENQEVTVEVRGVTTGGIPPWTNVHMLLDKQKINFELTGTQNKGCWGMPSGTCVSPTYEAKINSGAKGSVHTLGFADNTLECWPSTTFFTGVDDPNPSCNLDHKFPLAYSTACYDCLANNNTLRGGIDYILSQQPKEDNCSRQEAARHSCNGGVSPENQEGCLQVATSACASACGLPTPTPTGSTTLPPSSKTAFYRVSTAPFGTSNNPEWKAYSNVAGMTEDLDFGDKPVGSKLIVYAQFKSTTEVISSVSKEIEYVGADPIISSIECGYSPAGDGTEIRINGENFGDQGTKSSINFNNKIAQIISWGNQMNPTSTSVPPTEGPSATPSIAPSITSEPTITSSPTSTSTPTPTSAPTLTNLLTADMQNATITFDPALPNPNSNQKVQWFVGSSAQGTFSLSGSSTDGGVIQIDEYTSANVFVTTHANNSTFTTSSGNNFAVILRKASVGTATFSSVSLTSPTAVLGVSSKSSVVAKISDKLKENLAIPVFIETANGRRSPKSGQLYCTINLTTINFVALTQCRPPANLGGEIRVQIYENIAGAKPVYDKKVLVANDGSVSWAPSSALPIVEVGKKYILIIKSAKGIAIKKEFTASPGSTILDDINLPVGDIAPLASPDNTINSADYSELKREWNAVTDVTRVGDLNMDNRINSVDYSCMRNSFNQSGAKFLTGQ